MSKMKQRKAAKLKIKWKALCLGSSFNWDSLHARLNSHYKAWTYKKKKHKKINTYRKSVLKNTI